MDQDEKPYMCTAVIDRATALSWKLLAIDEDTTSKGLLYEGFGLLLVRYGFDLPSQTIQSIQDSFRPLPDAIDLPRWGVLTDWHATSDETLPSFRGLAKRVAATFGTAVNHSVFIDPATIGALRGVSEQQNTSRESLHYEAMSMVFRRHERTVPPLISEMLKGFHRPSPEQGIIDLRAAPA